MIQEVKAGEKIITLVNACLMKEPSNALSSTEVSKLLSCCERTAHRMMKLLYDMRFHLGAFHIEYTDITLDGYDIRTRKQIKVTKAPRI